MKQKAFTLLETIVVITVITMFFAISAPLFSRFMERSKLDTAARNITSALRTARSYAITYNKNYDVVFDASQDPDEYYISDGTNIVEKKYKLPAGIEFGDIQFALGTTATFLPTGGLNETNAETSIEITDGSSIRTITVEKTTGRAKID